MFVILALNMTIISDLSIKDTSCEGSPMTAGSSALLIMLMEPYTLSGLCSQLCRRLIGPQIASVSMALSLWLSIFLC